MTTKNEQRQMTLEEIEQAVGDAAGTDWRVMVRNKENGHVQIRSTVKSS